jgi:hypothetical protein
MGTLVSGEPVLFQRLNNVCVEACWAAAAFEFLYTCYNAIFGRSPILFSLLYDVPFTLSVFMNFAATYRAVTRDGK